ncbi:MAG: 3'-5' exonuclease [Phycisphaerae bacterium]|nr:3'-5' exonuclease [Phycisphaerae bacterium]
MTMIPDLVIGNTIDDSDSYMVFDFETPGLDYRRDRIVQVGICQVVDGNVADAQSWLVNQAVQIPSEATQTHGITTERMMADGIPTEDSVRRLLTFLAQARECVGHNVHRFDVLFLTVEASRYGLACPSFRDYVDTAALFKGWKVGMHKSHDISHEEYANRVLSIPVAGLKYSLPVCIEELGIALPTDNLHDAGRDCHATHLIYEELKGISRQS